MTVRTKSLEGLLTVVGSDGFSIAIRLVSAVIVARWVGADGRGILAVLYATPMLMQGLFSIGLREAFAFHLANILQQRKAIISTTLLLAGLSCLIGVLVSNFYGNFLTKNTYDPVLIALASFNLPMNIMLELVRGYFLSQKKFWKFSSVIVFSSLFRLPAVILLVVVFDLGVLGAILADLICPVLGLIWIYLLDLKEKKLEVAPKRALLPKIISMSSRYAVTALIVVAQPRVGILVLETVSTTAAMGIYAVASTLAEMMANLSRAVQTVSFTHRLGVADSAAADELLIRRARLSFIMLFAGACAALPAPFVVPLIFGSEFAEAGWLLLWFLPGLVLGGVAKVIAADVAARGTPLKTVWATGPSLAVNVVLALSLAPHYGPAGAAAAVSAAQLVELALCIALYSKVSGVRASAFFEFGRRDVTDVLIGLPMTAVRSIRR